LFDGFFCIERDALGEVLVPADANYGTPNTQQAVKNFPVSGIRFPMVFVRSSLGKLSENSFT
jgi:fumarate hydratase class II